VSADECVADRIQFDPCYCIAKSCS
jgi:hypothetical protein